MNRCSLRIVAGALVAIGITACASEQGGPDVRDGAGSQDGTAADIASQADVIADRLAPADVPAVDAIASDSTVPDALTQDAAAPDVGTDSSSDASADSGADGGSASVIRLAITCDELVDAVYATPPGLPAMTPELRGTIVHCARDSSFDQAMVQQQLEMANVAGVTATSGVDLYRITYRTYRDATRAGLTSARVYIPHTPLPAPRPVVVLGHPTDGIADRCATSRAANSGRNIALPYAATGYVTIVPDLAGFGTDGTQGYTDQADTGRSMLDGTRALRRMLAAGSLGTRVVFSGYSQGGGGVFSAQGLANTYGLEGEIAALVPFAAQWRTRMNSFRLVSALSQPSRPTAFIDATGTVGVVATMSAYAWFENFVGEGRGGEAFPSGRRTETVGALNSLCLVEYGGYVQGRLYTVNDWLDSTFRTQFLACSVSTADPGCASNGRAFYEHLSADIIAPSASWAPVLYVQGGLDQIMPPAREAACNVAALRAAGTDVTVCADSGATHGTVTERNMARALAWVSARLAGTAPPACPGTTLPTCDP